MFSQFANATREDGSLLDVSQVVDHMIFLMLAAHDTITSAASSLLYYLLKNPEFAATLRAIAERGADAFYAGPVAEAIVQAARDAPNHAGDITLEDFDTISTSFPSCCTEKSLDRPNIIAKKFIATPR